MFELLALKPKACGIPGDYKWCGRVAQEKAARDKLTGRRGEISRAPGRTDGTSKEANAAKFEEDAQIL